MKIKHLDIVVDEKDPFKNCRLQRKPYAEALTSIVNSYSDGFVLSINNVWGTGKTTFIKMWSAYLKKQEYETIYFNSWENDFEGNPLIAIMSELGSITNSKNDVKFKKLISKAAILTKSILPSLVKAFVARYIDSKVLIDSLENLAEGGAEILKDEIEEHAAKKQGLREFRKELTIFIEEKIEKKPLVFVIDELDRCRPNYAVEVLEQVKHFFSVPGIVFVLSIDKKQLGNAIKGVYGSEQLDSNEYLRRFIDIEFSLPKPSTEAYCKYLISYFGFSDYFFSEDRRKHEELKYDGDTFLKFSTILFEKANLTLRQQEKIFVHARVVLKSFNVNNYVFPSLFILLIYIKELHADYYQKLYNKQAGPQEILNGLKDIFPSNIDEETARQFLVTEVQFIVLYNNYHAEYRGSKEIIEQDSEGKSCLKIKSLMDRTDDGREFIAIYDSYYGRNGIDLKLDFLLNKINLMHSILAD